MLFVTHASTLRWFLRRAILRHLKFMVGKIFSMDIRGCGSRGKLYQKRRKERLLFCLPSISILSGTSCSVPHLPNEMLVKAPCLKLSLVRGHHTWKCGISEANRARKRSPELRYEHCHGISLPFFLRPVFGFSHDWIHTHGCQKELKVGSVHMLHWNQSGLACLLLGRIARRIGRPGPALAAEMPL